MMLGNGDQAVAAWKQAITMNPDGYPARVGLAATYGAIGAEDQAQAAGKDVLTHNPSFAVQSWVMAAPYKNEADLERELNGLRKAGVPEN